MHKMGDGADARADAAAAWGLRLGPPREARRKVVELYSPPTVTSAAKLLPEFGPAPGLALDLTCNDEEGDP